MKRLKVAVIVKNTPSAFEREGRNMGMWSYPVPQFDWEFFTLGKGFEVHRRDYSGQGFDLIFHEDGGNWGYFRGSGIPVVYYSIDSTLSQKHHFMPRYIQAQRSDLVLVDHDDLERFRIPDLKTLRLLYCVNDHLFKPVVPPDNAIDVNFHCSGGSDLRKTTRRWLQDYCNRQRRTYTSGVLPLRDYAYAMANSRVVVNIPRNTANRPHRIYDALACWTCLLTTPFAAVSGENFSAGIHYHVTQNYDIFEKDLDLLLTDETLRLKIATAGYEWVKLHHTWAARANDLRLLIYNELGI